METLAQVLPGEICEICKSTFSYRALAVAASVIIIIIQHILHKLHKKIFTPERTENHKFFSSLTPQKRNGLKRT